MLAGAVASQRCIAGQIGQRGADTDHIAGIFNVVGRGEGTGPSHSAIG